jgi:hypothetical protein
LAFSAYISDGFNRHITPDQIAVTQRTISNKRWIVTHILREALMSRTQICLAAATDWL